jgi:hypothetical protein
MFAFGRVVASEAQRVIPCPMRICTYAEARLRRAQGVRGGSMDRPESAPHVGVLRPDDRAFPLLTVVACSFAWRMPRAGLGWAGWMRSALAVTG